MPPSFLLLPALPDLAEAIQPGFQHYLLGLVAVANNIPAIGPFITLTKGLPRGEIRKLTWIATATSGLIMVLAMLIGTAVLSFFGITISAFQIAGGLLLGSSGLSMLNARGTDEVSGKQIDHADINEAQLVSTAIVPISLPLTAGAGTMATVTVFAEQSSRLESRAALGLAIAAMTLIIYLGFRFASSLQRVCGETGMSVLLKVMGLFTLAIGIQFIITGVSGVLEGLTLAR